MINQVTAAVATSLMLAASPAQAAQFPVVSDGFMGTQFRGIALGQSRAEVEAALAENGFRCLTAEEYPHDPVQGLEYTMCSIVPTNFVYDAMGKVEISIRPHLQQQIGLPYYAVAFIGNVASAITLEPGYFNASGTTPHYFAQQIADNYGLLDGMVRYGSGWRGTTANDEELQVQTVFNGQYALLIVTAATEQSTPSFD